MLNITNITNISKILQNFCKIFTRILHIFCIFCIYKNIFHEKSKKIFRNLVENCCFIKSNKLNQILNFLQNIIFCRNISVFYGVFKSNNIRRAVTFDRNSLQTKQNCSVITPMIKSIRYTLQRRKS